MGADRAEEALQALREALLAEPDNADVHRQIRRLIAQERIEGGALGFYRELAKERPSYKSIQELFGEELMRAREWGEAREHFESFADRWPEDRGARLAALFAGAMERGEEGMAELLGGVFGDPPASADEVVELAGLFLGANASASAEALLERANEQWPADPRLAVMLASAQISEGRRDEAIATLEELNEVNPGDPQAVGALTQLYLEKYQPARQQDDHDEAIVWLKKLTALNDRAPAFHLEAGGLFLQSGRLEEAEAAVRQGLERFPEESGFYLLGGNVFYEKKEIDEAEKILRRGIEKFPGDASLYNNLGYFLTEAGRNLEEALKLVEKANELEPGQDFILDSVGWTHFKLGNAAKAVEFLEKAILANAANPQGPDPVLFDHLGDAYAKAGDRDKALAQWRRALEIDPESEKVDAAAIQKKIDGR
jgi:tetratricopeptide (TPR) repeat protein